MQDYDNHQYRNVDDQSIQFLIDLTLLIDYVAILLYDRHRIFLHLSMISYMMVFHNYTFYIDLVGFFADPNRLIKNQDFKKIEKKNKNHPELTACNECKS